MGFGPPGAEPRPGFLWPVHQWTDGSVPALGQKKAQKRNPKHTQRLPCTTWRPQPSASNHTFQKLRVNPKFQGASVTETPQKCKPLPIVWAEACDMKGL